MSELNPVEHRRHMRLPCEGAAEVYLSPEEEPKEARVADLSQEGALVVLAEEQPTVCGSLVEMTFNVNHLSFRVRGEVMVVRSPTMIGLRFPLLSLWVRNQLFDLIEELKESHARQEANKLTVRNGSTRSGSR